ncbi:hypothetical protein [Nonomuraea sp. NPDC049504]|uniref:hypothetical protein n=1 Tax=Nonomuraea sp. NPDC049504 TaxID=3154729 RepID=UPI00344746E0
MGLIVGLRCETIRVGAVRAVLMRAEESGVLLAMILWYSIPVVVVGVSLFVRSRSLRRKVVYLSLALVALVLALVVAWVMDREEWGVWLFFLLPAVLVTGVRLIVSGVLARAPAGR